MAKPEVGSLDLLAFLAGVMPTVLSILEYLILTLTCPAAATQGNDRTVNPQLSHHCGYITALEISL